MTTYDAATDFPEHFAGKVRLFPLPNLVLFPHVIQPLRIFEPRYRAMMEEALASDRLIAMALLLPGWEKTYFENPPIASVVCIGRVVTHTREVNGDYKLLLLGLRRARIVAEHADANAKFRRADVAVLEDYYAPHAAHERPELQQRLLNCFQDYLPSDRVMRRHYDRLLSSQLPLGVLTDIVSFSLALPVELKQMLLGELDVDRRAQLLIQSLPAAVREREFPPRFSDN